MASNEKIETKTSEIWIDEEGILHLKIKEDAEVNLEEVKILFNIYQKLGCRENKVLQLMEGGTFFTFDNKALKYAARVGKDFFIASAIVSDSLPTRMLFRFFNGFYKHPVPFKMFTAEEKALEWLRTFKKK